MKIYGLIDPRTAQLLYVGASSRPLARRLQAHIHRAIQEGPETTAKNEWLWWLLREDLVPLVQELEEAEADNWEAREQFWIEVLQPGLLNATPGGLGVRGMSAEIRAKIARGCSGKNQGNQHAAGQIISQERREAARLRLTGKNRDTEIKSRISEGLRRYHARRRQCTSIS